MSGREFTHPSRSNGIALLESCPACGEVMDMCGMQPFTRVACSSCGKEFIARRWIDHFKILEPLAEGGIGAVYRAIDRNLDREVALKILKLETGGNAAGADAFEHEARAMAGILHSNIVRVFDFGRCQGVFYMAMEFLSGGSLDDLIQTCGTVDESRVLEIGIQVAEGLEAALQEGLLHRDIKPANILFSDSRAPKLVDFGPGAKSLGEIWGTPHYIAPEKLDECPEDFRSDIYSLGSTLFHALAGRPPYETENVSLAELRRLKKFSVDLRAAVPGVSAETACAINRMMEIDPAKRHACHGELIDHLRLALRKILGLRLIDASVAGA
jgi:serine/threonine protein kinase